MSLDNDSEGTEVTEPISKENKTPGKQKKRIEKPLVEKPPLVLPTEPQAPKSDEPLIYDVKTAGPFLTCRVPYPEVAKACLKYENEGYEFRGAADTPLRQPILIFKKK